MQSYTDSSKLKVMCFRSLGHEIIRAYYAYIALEIQKKASKNFFLEHSQKNYVIGREKTAIAPNLNEIHPAVPNLQLLGTMKLVELEQLKFWLKNLDETL